MLTTIMIFVILIFLFVMMGVATINAKLEELVRLKKLEVEKNLRG